MDNQVFSSDGYVHDLLDDLFNYFLDLDDLDSHNFNWYYLFNNELNWFQDFSYSLLDNRNLFDNLESLCFSDDVVDWLFYLDILSVNYSFFNNFLDFYDFSHFLLERNNHLSFSRYFYDFLFNGRHLDEFFDDIVYNFNNLDWLVDDLLDFDVLWHLNNLLNVLFDGDHLRYFNNPLNYFLNNSFHFYYSLFHSEHFKDIVYADNIKNLLINHTNNSLVNLQDSSILSLNFFELLKQSLNQNSQMELYLFGS